MYTYCIKERGRNKIYHRTITKAEITNENILDREVVRQCIEDIKRFDRTVGYYSGPWRYDIPFIRSRALYHGLDFPEYGSRFHTDLYPVVKKNLSMHSRKLKEVAKLCLGKSQKTELDPKHWIMAMSGHEKSLGYILKHCKYDVIDLELVHQKLEPFYLERDTSI
jgi:DNA polymerase elongation subunit (family B)